MIGVMRVIGLLWLVGIGVVLGDARENLLERLEGKNLVLSTNPERGGIEHFEIWVGSEQGETPQLDIWLRGDGDRSAMVQMGDVRGQPVFYSSGGLSTVMSKRLPGMMETTLGTASSFEVSEDAIKGGYFAVGGEPERWVEIEIDVLETKVLRNVRLGAPVVQREIDGVECFWVYRSPDSRIGVMMAPEGEPFPVRCMVFEGEDGDRFSIWVEPLRDEGEPVTLEGLREVGLMSRVRNFYRWRARTEGWNARERSAQEKGLKLLEVPLESLMQPGLSLDPVVLERFQRVIDAAGWVARDDRGRVEALVAEPWIELGRDEPVWRDLWECKLEFPDGVDRLVLPVSWVMNCPVVTLTIDGDVVEPVILDTGAESTVIANSVADFDGDWSLSKTSRMYGVGGDRPLETRQVKRLDVGGLGTTLDEVAVAELERGLGLGGFLGRDLLGTVPFTLDPERGEVVFYRPSAFSPPEGALRFEVFEYDDGTPVVEVAFGHGEDPLPCLPDTGFSSWLSVNRETFDARIDPAWIARKLFGTTFGPFGKSSVDEVRLTGAGNGQVAPFGFPLGDGVIDVHAKGDAHGVIGMGVMGGYRVTFDLRGRAIYLEPVDTPEIPRKSELYEALKRGNAALVGDLLEAGARPDEETVVRSINSGQVDVLERFDAIEPGSVEERRELAEVAVFRGDEAMVKYLLDWGVAADGRRRGFSLLAPALAAENRSMVELLLEAGAQVTPRDLMALLAAEMDAEIVSVFLEKVAPSDLGEHVPEEFVDGVAGMPWLSLAAMKGNREAVRFFLGRGDVVDRRDGNGNTAVMLAVAAGNRGAAEELLEAGASIEPPGEGRGGVLSVASEYAEAEMLEWLLERDDVKPQIGTPDGGRAVRIAILAGDAAKVKALVDAGVDLQTDGEFGIEVLPMATAMMLKAVLAAKGESAKEEKLAGLVEAVRVFVEAEASVGGPVAGSGYRVAESLAGDARTVALMRRLLPAEGAVERRDALERAMVVAAATGTSPAMAALIADGGPVASGDVVVKGEDPIWDAVIAGQAEVLALLLEAGANPAARWKEEGDWSLLHLAAKNGDAASIRILVAAGAPVDARDQDDATPLMRAAEARGRTAVRALLDAGADAAAKDWLGRDAAELARRHEEPKEERMVELLEEAKVKP